ncbi:SRPBCC family protein [Azospirillum doebereinerae]
MDRVEESMDIAAPADRVWRILGDFSGIAAWAAGVRAVQVDGDGVGAIRRLDVGGSAELVERLEARDDALRWLVYTVQSGPLPVRNYRAEIRVEEEESDRARVTWTASYQPLDISPEKCERMFRKAFAQGLRNLDRLATAGIG